MRKSIQSQSSSPSHFAYWTWSLLGSLLLVGCSEPLAINMPNADMGAAAMNMDMSVDMNTSEPDVRLPYGISGRRLGTNRWAFLLCKYADVSSEPKPLSYFNDLLKNSHPGLDEFWRELSYNKMDISNSIAVGWYTLPQPESYYVQNGELIMDKLLADCTALAESDVYFPDYYGIGFMLNGDSMRAYGISSGSLWRLHLNAVEHEYATTYIDAKGSFNMALVAHEMTHSYGAPGHSCVYDESEKCIAGNKWDALGGTCAYAAIDSKFGCIPIHLIAPIKQKFGWLSSDQIANFPPGSNKTVTLEQLAQPPTTNYLMAQIPILGSLDTYYTVEVRRRIGYDYIGNNDKAVLIHKVNSSFPEGPALIPASTTDPGGKGAIWNVGSTFFDNENGIAIKILSETATGYSIEIKNLP